MILDDTPAVLSLGRLCQDHGYSYEWTMVRSHRRKKSNIAKYVPVVVSGLSTSSSSSSTPTSPTSVLQEAEHPASTRSESSSWKSMEMPVAWTSKKQKTQIQMTPKEYEETRCVICQNGQKSFFEHFLTFFRRFTCLVRVFSGCASWCFK